MLTLNDQYTFSQACLAPDEEQPLPKLSKKLYYSIVAAVNFLVVVLYITITIKVKAYPQVNLKEIPWHWATNSRHFCTVSAVCTLYQSVIIWVVIFLGSPHLWKLVSGAKKYTNMAHVRPEVCKKKQSKCKTVFFCLTIFQPIYRFNVFNICICARFSGTKVFIHRSYQQRFPLSNYNDLDEH